MARPNLGQPDPHARARELLAGRRIPVPDVFDAAALTMAWEKAAGGDRLLAFVLERRHEGRVAQYLAGAPELLARYHGASAGARALLQAAMDARRLGVGLHLPLAFLADATPDYLGPDDYDTLAEDWLEQALAELAKPVYGNLAPPAPGTRTPHLLPIGPGWDTHCRAFLPRHWAVVPARRLPRPTRAA